MKKVILRTAALCMASCLLLAGCRSAVTGNAGGQTETQTAASAQTESQTAASAQETLNSSQQPEGGEAMSEYTDATKETLDRQLNNEATESEETETMLQMKIGNTSVTVNWEDNESVEALKELCQDGPLTIQMSMYGGFEQVGSIGQSLPRNDSQTTTQAGDIVLYSGNQIVVFYGSNSWAYTRLGRITDQSAQEMAELLGNGDVTITIER